MEKLPPVIRWNPADVCSWAGSTFNCTEIVELFRNEKICGQALLSLTEQDLWGLRKDFKYTNLRLGDIKRVWGQVKQLQRANGQTINYLDSAYHGGHHVLQHHDSVVSHGCSDFFSDRVTPPCSVDGRATCKPELFKTIISLGE